MPVRQWLGVYRARSPARARRPAHQNDLYHARQPMGKRVRGKFPQPLPRRVPQPRAALDSDRSSRRHRGLPPGLQQSATPQLAGLPVAAALRHAAHALNPSLRSAYGLPPRWIANLTFVRHINQPPGLTPTPARIPRPRHRCGYPSTKSGIERFYVPYWLHNNLPLGFYNALSKASLQDSSV